MRLPWWLRWRCRKGFHRWAPWERDFETWTATLRCIHCPATRAERLAPYQIRQVDVIAGLSSTRGKDSK